MYVRKRIIIVIVLIVAIASYGIYIGIFADSKHDREAAKSFKQLEKLLASHEDGEVITTAKNPEQVAHAVEKRFGKYFTEDYSKKVERKIWAAMRDDPDFEENPERITFFLVNKGDGFQFSQPEMIEHSSWLTKENSIKGTKILIYFSDDDPMWEEADTGISHIIMLKDGWKYKVNDIEK
ncbi:MAG TPA: hypothetical protein VK144_08380 [Bacillota bacterium]|nr:hypothetical protein [Bacillota bacterium]